MLTAGAREVVRAADAFKADPSADTALALRQAIDDGPPALQGSPALAGLEEMLDLFEDPVAASLLTPLLKSGLFEDPAKLPDETRSQGIIDGLRGELAVGDRVLEREYRLLNQSLAKLDMSDPDTFQASLNALPDAEAELLMSRLTGFTRAWNSTAKSDLSGEMDAAAQALARRGVEDLKSGARDADAEAALGRAADVFGRIQTDYDPGVLPDVVDPSQTPDYQEFLGEVRSMFGDLGAAFDLDQNAFATTDVPVGFPYTTATGPLAIDGVATNVPRPVPNVPIEATPGLVVPEDPAPPQDGWSVARDLALPGAPGVEIPMSATALAASPGLGEEIFPLANQYIGTVNLTNKVDFFLVRLPENALNRIFLQAANGNADLELVCDATGKTWASRSTAASYRPGFDSISFVNTPGGAAPEAFIPDGSQTCAGGRFTLYVKLGPGETRQVSYLLEAGNEYYAGSSCGRDCGLDGAHWAGRCLPRAGGCPGGTNENSHTWAGTLSADREQPVVFIHGVGADSGVWTDPQSETWFAKTCLDCVKTIKLILLAVSAVALYYGTVLIIAMMLYKMALFGPPLFTAFLWITILVLWLQLFITIIEWVVDAFKWWRYGDSADVGGYFFSVRDAGFETYWIEYNYGANDVPMGQNFRTSPQIKQAVNAIQQDFYDRHREEPGFPFASPEDVKVDVVVHSNGGLVSRIYSTRTDAYPEGSYVGPFYEGDFNKWITIQTPNMGSSPAKWAINFAKVLATWGVFKLVLVMILVIALGFMLELPFIPIIIVAVKYYTWIIILYVAVAILWTWKFGTLENRADIIRDNSGTSTAWVNGQPVAPGVDYGMIYGDALSGKPFGFLRFDGLVEETDLKGPGQLLAVSAVGRIHNDHGSALHVPTVRDILTMWLLNGDAGGLPAPPQPPDPPEGAAAAERTFARAEGDEPDEAAHSLLLDFGQDLGDRSLEPGARYVPEGGALVTPAPAGRAAPTAEGDSVAKLERLAILKDLPLPGASAASALGRETAAEVAAEMAGGGDVAGVADRRGDQAESLGQSVIRQGGGAGAASQRVADVAVLQSGHYKDAAGLLERLGEPRVMVTPGAFPSELATRRVVVVPTGGLAGLANHPSLGRTLDQFVRAGGSLVVLGQQRGADLAAVPGAPAGFGFAEEEGAYRGSAVFASFTPALSGQATAAPDLHVDGSFTRLPDGATVLLRHAKNGRPVVASYAWGAGEVVVAQVVPDWADGALEGTTDERRLVRDILADVRLDPVPVGAPRASATIAVDLGALPATAADVTLQLVDAGSFVVHEETLAPAASYAWAVPENVTAGGVYEVDVIVRDANATLLARRVAVASVYAAAFAADPAGFRPTLADVLMDVTSADDRVEVGSTFAFVVSVTNNGAAARDVTLGWWFPEHAAATGDAAYGAGAPRDGAAAAWDDSFQLRQTVTVAAGATATLPLTLPSALRSDAASVRAYAADGAVLGEARRTFTVYQASVAVAATPDTPIHAAGDTVRVAVVARDPAAGPLAGTYPVTLTATLRDAAGAVVDVETRTVSVAAAPAFTNVTLALPAAAAAGTYVGSVEARRGAERVGSAAFAVRVPGVQVRVAPTLPTSFAAGAASRVDYVLTNPGAEPADPVALTVRLLGPTGTEQWTGSATVSLAPGASASIPLDVTPTTAELGTYRLVHEAVAGGSTFAGEAPIRSAVSTSIGFGKPGYRVRETLRADATFRNDGRFALPVDLALSTDAGLAPLADARTLAPGQTATLTLEGPLAPALGAGARAVVARVEAGGTTSTVTRSFSILPASVRLDPPGAGPVLAGADAAATLVNVGGADADVPWTATLTDATGLLVASASGTATAVAGASVPIGVTVPPQAASGTYRLDLSAQILPGRPNLLARPIAVDGAAATVTFTAPLSAEAGSTIPVGVGVTSLGTPLTGATVTVTAARPAPLPAWEGLPAAAGATGAVEHGGYLWLGTNDGVLRRAADGTLVRHGLAEGLPSVRVTALAVALGTVYAGTEKGLARLDGATWTAITDLAGLPTRHVRALAGTPDVLYVGTDDGVVRADASGLSLVPLPAQAVRALAVDGREAWAALADAKVGFPGTDRVPVGRVGDVSSQPAIALAPDGDIHLVYVDNPEGSSIVLHLRLSPEGEPRAAPTLVSSGDGTRYEPTVAVDRSGKVHVVWTDTRTGDGDVWYRLLGPDGTPISAERALVAHAGTNQRFPKLALDPRNDDVVVVWGDDRDPNPDGARYDDVYLLRMEKDGDVRLAAHRLTDRPKWTLRPEVAIDATGNAHVVWTDTTTKCIFVFFIVICYPVLEAGYGKWAPNGTVLVPPKFVSVEDNDLSWLPTITLDDDGNADIVYQDDSRNSIELAYARVNATGAVVFNGARLTSRNAQPWWPETSQRNDGRLDVVWIDARSGRPEAWHNVLDPATRAFVGDDERVNAVGGRVRGIEIASDGGPLHVAWDDTRTGRPELRLASTEITLTGRGLARVDRQTDAVTVLRASSGLLPSDRVTSLALAPEHLAALTPAGVAIHDRLRGGWETVTLGAAATGVALADGRAYLAGARGARVLDLATGVEAALPAGGPEPATLVTATSLGLLAAGPRAGGLYLGARDDVVATASAPYDGAPVALGLGSPAEGTRLLLRARLVSATGQTLAEDVGDVVLTRGALAVTVRPATAIARPGEPVDLVVHVANRGADDLGAVDLTVTAGGASILTQRLPLAAGEARTFPLRVARATSFDVVATAEGRALALPGAPVDVTGTFRDHVRVEPPAIAVRVEAPSVASREPFAVGALLANPGLLPLRVVVALDGGVPRAVEIPARSRVLVADLGTATALADRALTVRVSGDATAAATKLVRAGERAVLTETAGAVGPAGARTVAFTFRGEGLLATAFGLSLALDGAALPAQPVEVAPGGLGAAETTLTLAPGVHLLSWRTPWESGELRLAAGDRALPVLTIGEHAVVAGNLTATVRVENAGPGRLAGALEADHGFALATVALDLAEGDGLDVPVRLPLAGMPPGASTLAVRVVAAEGVRASATRAFEAPGPVLRFAAIPSAVDAHAGDTVSFAYLVENVGEVAGAADVAFVLGGADAQTARLELAPGESASVTFDARLEADARDGEILARATAPGAAAETPVRVRGARIVATAAAAQPAYPAGATAELVLAVSNPGDRPLDLVARATLGDATAAAPLRLGAGEAGEVRLPLAVADDDARWTVSLASGRALAAGAARFAIDHLATDGIRVESDREAYAPTDTVQVTVTTSIEGRVDLLGPGFRDVFVLNGTTTREYAFPAGIPAGRYSVFWTFDATNATGTLTLAVSGVEVRNDGLALEGADEAVAPGAPLVARWSLAATAPVPVVIRSWFEDDAGEVFAPRTQHATLAAGASTIVLAREVPALAPGGARLVLALSPASQAAAVVLARDSAPFDVRGVALRDLSVVDDGAGSILVRLEAASAGPETARVTIVQGGTVALDETLRVEGVVAREVTIPLPEPGAYPVRVAVETDDGRVEREILGTLPGLGTPPVSAVAIGGATFLRPDGQLAAAGDATFAFTATDEGSGVASIEIFDDAGPVRAGPAPLTPGWHNLSWRAVDRAGNAESMRHLRVFVDAAAPDLTLAAPLPGSVHAAGDVVSDAAAGDAVGAPVVTVDPAGAAPDLPWTLLDADGDGHPDVEETIEGSDPADNRSVPARWAPAAPPPAPRSVLAIGAVRVRAAAVDEGTGVAFLTVLLDGRLVASRVDALDEAIDLSQEAPGDHELTIVATDALGQSRRAAVRLFVVPTTADGAAKADPSDPRLPPWSFEVAAWLTATGDSLPGVVADESARRVARVDAAVLDVMTNVVDPAIPPAVRQADEQIEANRRRIQQAIDECACAPEIGLP